MDTVRILTRKYKKRNRAEEYNNWNEKYFEGGN